MYDREAKEGRERSPARRFLDQVLSSRSAELRIAGALIGLLSVVLPWGSIMVRDPIIYATTSLTSVWFIDLIVSPMVLVSIASVLFIAAMILAILDARAAVLQLAALVVLAVTIPDNLRSMLTELGPTLPEGIASTSIAIGFYLGLLSALVTLVSLIPFKKVGHEVKTDLIGSERTWADNPYYRWR